MTGIASSFGNAAAVTAAAVDINNRQMTKEDGDLIRKLARKYAESQGWCTNGECDAEVLDRAMGQLTLQTMLDAGSSAAAGAQNNPAAEAFLRAQPEYNTPVPLGSGLRDPNREYPPVPTYFTASNEHPWTGYYSTSGVQSGKTEYTDDRNSLGPWVTEANSDLYDAASRARIAQIGCTTYGIEVNYKADLLNQYNKSQIFNASYNKWVVQPLAADAIFIALGSGKLLEPMPFATGPVAYPLEPVAEAYNPNVPLTKGYLASAYGAGNVEQGGGTALQTAEGIWRNSSGGVADAFSGANLTSNLATNMSKPTRIIDQSLANIIDDLYRRNAQIGAGSTADAVRYELSTGQQVGGVDHSLKAQEYTTALLNWMAANPDAAFSDRSAAEHIIIDMKNALKGK